MIQTNNIYYSRILVIAYLIIGVASYISDWTVFNIMSLNPALIMSHLEFWRMLTFSILPAGIEGTLLFAYTFWFIGPKLEDRFDRQKLFLLLPVVSFIIGSIFSLIFLNQNINLTGSEGLSLFVLTLYILLEIKQEDTLFSAANPSSMTFVLLITVIWFTVSVIVGTFGPNEFALPSIIAASIGIMISLFVYLQLKLASQIFGSRRNPAPKVTLPQPEELIGTSSAKRETMTLSSFEDEPYDIIGDTDSEYFSEERLDRILDKINEHGKESLSSDEKLFLEEYSNNL